MPPAPPNLRLIRQIYSSSGTKLTSVRLRILKRDLSKEAAPTAEGEPRALVHRKSRLGLIRKCAAPPGPVETGYISKRLALIKDAEAEDLNTPGGERGRLREGQVRGSTSGARITRSGGPGVNTKQLEIGEETSVEHDQGVSGRDAGFQIKKHATKRAAFGSTYWNLDNPKKRIDAQQKYRFSSFFSPLRPCFCRYSSEDLKSNEHLS
ncbi:hypothetical protein ONS95_001965 [Cadophora gregata]|uniref:uncharacterized protein n=1 Tax=Cadophora gregata TaxID=51156 RepID=UPI0026DB40D9|nr:uncharacterized protein ONS95_001965 [Cadophora gregata]KAK0111619.1 hypothetical protein ONS95_001965 [Cadophora gregata]